MSIKSLFAVGATLVVTSTALLASGDGAALYKTKCAGCHGANGEGKPAVKAPALKGTSLDTNKIVEHVTKGEPQSKPPHNKGISGLTDEQAKALGRLPCERSDFFPPVTICLCWLLGTRF